MLALITVVMENFDAVRAALREGGPPPPGLLGSASAIPEALVEQMGGRLLAVDLDRGRLRGQRALPTPSGLCWPDAEGPLLVASMWGDALLQVDPASGQVCGRVEHPAMNEIHTVTSSVAGPLLTCTGVDALLELRSEGPWAWFAPPRPTPVRAPLRPDPAADHRGRRYATLDRGLHLNSALRLGERILASAFHTGEILEIDPVSGDHRVARAGLDHPHALVVAGEEGGLPEPTLLCCESPRGELRLLDPQDLSDRGRLRAPGLRWLQAAEPSGRGTLLLLDNPHFGLGARGAGPSRLVELDPRTGTSTTRLELPAGWRLLAACPLPPERAARIRWLDG